MLDQQNLPGIVENHPHCPNVMPGDKRSYSQLQTPTQKRKALQPTGQLLFRDH
jgi:hypothetical protein